VGVALLGSAATTWGATIVGSTTGKFAVSPAGAATYTIPLVLPPGAGGMEPQLALSYSSQGPDTDMGPGFSVAGLSQIAVCPTTIFDDGHVGGRVICLDGQRLVNVGSGEYRTRVDTFSQVRFDGNGYTVHTKSGITNTYGEDGSTRFGESQPLVWLLQRSIDTTGNYIDYHYLLPSPGQTGAYFPKEIDYGGNLQQGTPPTVAVKFRYQTQTGFRPYGYLYSQIIDWNRLLTEIDVVDLPSGRTLRSWKVTYHYPCDNCVPAKSYPLTTSSVVSADQRPFPASVQDCAADVSGATQCAPPTTFAYAPPVGTQQTLSYATGDLGGSGFQTATGDFDGDGRADIIGFERDGFGVAHGFVIRGSDPSSPVVWSTPKVPLAASSWSGTSTTTGSQMWATLLVMP
jgi:FG-GAP repeat./Salmonella virulence plasmid 65kDa B protein.